MQFDKTKCFCLYNGDQNCTQNSTRVGKGGSRGGGGPGGGRVKGVAGSRVGDI